MALAALAAVSNALRDGKLPHGFQFWALLLLALFTAKFRVKLPGF
jgi:hypothetical protein